MKRIKKSTIIIVITAFWLALIARRMWPLFSSQSLFAIGLATAIFASSLKKILQNRNSNIELSQFAIFLEYLSARVSSGENLQTALLHAPKRLFRQLAGSHFFSSLESLSAALSSQLSLEESLIGFQREFDHPKGQAFIRILPFLHHYGGRLDIYLRQSYRSLSSELQTQKEIQAAQSAKNSEAFILLFMPFVMAFLIGNGDYGQSLYELPFASILLDILYLLAVLAAGFTLRLIARQDPYRMRKISLPKMAKKSDRKLKVLGSKVLNLLPSNLKLQINLSLKFIFPKEEALAERWLGRISFITCFIALLSLALAIIARQAYCLLIAPVYLLYEVMLMLQAKKLKNEAYRLEYPDFLSLMAILLKSGLSVERALLLQKDGSEKKSQSLLANDLQQVTAKIRNSVPVGRVLASLAAKMPAQEISSAINQLIRYARDGGEEILDILELQSIACWQVYKNAMRSKLERENLALVVPMGIDLMVILTICILPAMASFAAI
ncbi:MAG: type II secretion system F family protein [Eubacteriales bacterium]|nr:type II secretion system F family protein [Eubacteriales bacterium]